MSFTVCPQCGKGYTSYGLGPMISCPNCEYKFPKVITRATPITKETRETKEKLQPVWNKETQKMEY